MPLERVFLRYAADFWMHHCNQSAPKETTYFPLSRQFLGDPESLFTSCGDSFESFRLRLEKIGSAHILSSFRVEVIPLFLRTMASGLSSASELHDATPSLASLFRLPIVRLVFHDSEQLYVYFVCLYTPFVARSGPFVRYKRRSPRARHYHPRRCMKLAFSFLLSSLLSLTFARDSTSFHHLVNPFSPFQHPRPYQGLLRDALLQT